MTHQPDSDTPAPSEIIAREAEQEAFAAVQRIARDCPEFRGWAVIAIS